MKLGLRIQHRKITLYTFTSVTQNIEHNIGSYEDTDKTE